MISTLLCGPENKAEKLETACLAGVNGEQRKHPANWLAFSYADKYTVCDVAILLPAIFVSNMKFYIHIKSCVLTFIKGFFITTLNWR